ncbi:MAG: glycosyltransferase family 4 protein [Chloroflexi bacterium]|nr:glycosyltransferase family 4 protein [Chloroflexota bacterium]
MGKGVATMRVLMQGRSDLLTRHGGDTTQAVKTAEHLRELGLAVDFSTDVAPDLRAFDLVHVFNSTGISHVRALLDNAHRQRKPAVLSTIYWNQDELLNARLRYGKGRSLHRLLGQRVGGLMRRAIWHLQPEWRELRALVHAADALLPNSRAEQDLLYRDFGLPRSARIDVVVNGVDTALFQEASPEPIERRFGVRGFILCVGRIEIRKNQLALLHVLRPGDPPAVFIGAPNGLEPAYVARVNALAREKGVLVVDPIPHAEIASAYAAARVHILPSWYETPGLASLEAGLLGCPIVTTDRGCATEYFGEMALYCNPADPSSIRAALDKGLAAPRNSALARHIRDHFSWDVVAQQTLKVYRDACSH